MALTQGARNKIKSFVQAAKKLLMNEFENQLQQYYGIRPDGTSLLVEELTSRDASVIETARLLRQRLHYLEESIAGKNKAQEAVTQLKREQAFTILNRFAAVRMSEERNIIRESIHKGYNSEGFQVYDQLTGGAKTAEQFIRYTWYISHVFDELAIDLPAVFDRFSPYALLFPSERVLLELLDIINNEELNIYREAGYQPINLWIEDETIGWIYQYYNSREEIKVMRDASDAPRNSRELAVRNQFFTPRYVVQFLVDNSLGRQWYEMTKGRTALVDYCQYMVKRTLEIFLAKGEAIPDTKIEGANYIEYRALKDPREILMLDPACGSMHFGLYCFDLYEAIYLEAWDNHPELMADLRDKYMRDDFIKRIPGYILRYNIHGVDIDPRAIQIAGLSLWLRAQKSYDKLGLQPSDRPSISKSNLVIAEPMPGDVNLLSEFTKSLPGPIGKLVRVIWEKMKLAGETGLLLKIEEELKKEIEIAKQEYKEFKGGSTQASLFGGTKDLKAAEMAAIYGKGQKISKDFFDTAEEEVLKALKGFAENAEGKDAFQKLLFAEDTARGFAFIELCRKRYDVIVMNPPFGTPSLGSKDFMLVNYEDEKSDIFTAFVSRMCEIKTIFGSVGCISNRTSFFITSFKKWRTKLFDVNTILSFVDLGSGVLDAMVETCAYIITRNTYDEAIFLDLLRSEKKQEDLYAALISSKYISLPLSSFRKLPNFSISHWISKEELNCFENLKSFSKSDESRLATSGLTSGDDFRFFRLWWENDNKEYIHLAKGGAYAPYIGNFKLKVNWTKSGAEIKSVKNSFVRSEQYYFKHGITWSRRTSSLFSARVLPKNFIFADKGPAAFSKEILNVLGVFQSSNFRSLVEVQLAAGDQAARSYEVGIINNTPFPNFLEDCKSTINEIINRLISLLSFDETSLFYSGDFHLNSHDFSEIEALKEEIIDLNSKIVNIYKYKYAYEVDSPPLNLSTFTDCIGNLKEIEKNTLSFVFGNIFGRFNHLPKPSEVIQRFNDKFEVKEFKIETNKEFLLCDLSNPKPFERIIISSLKERGFDVQKIHNLTSDAAIDLTKYFSAPGGFFNDHISKYSDSGRKSPVYFPIGTRSNSYIIWLYYPALNENTLFSIVNELVSTKIKEIAKEIEVLDMKGSAKELNDQKEFLAELEDFKEELLRIAQLPYIPNQDDGVLITAAPLHNLFRHTKWKKSTQDCWKQLQKGEFDWAHLAYSIWPERVRKKCVKDLSMAIAHGLEDICEVKPKEKVEKKIKEIKPDQQGKLI
jgi:hypothetical protein